MKRVLRTAAAIVLRFVIMIALAIVGTNVVREAGTADEQQARLVAVVAAIVCVLVYYVSVKVSNRGFSAKRDSIAVLGILALAWLAMANMVAVNSHSRAVRTMADMRTLGTAIEEYGTDHNTYPQAKSLDELAKLLEPKYLRQMPRTDGWLFPFRYEVVGKATYYIGSSGSGGQWEKPHLRDYPKRVNKSHSDDIVFGNGEFIASPMP